MHCFSEHDLNSDGKLDGLEILASLSHHFESYAESAAKEKERMRSSMTEQELAKIDQELRRESVKQTNIKAGN